MTFHSGGASAVNTCCRYWGQKPLGLFQTGFSLGGQIANFGLQGQQFALAIPDSLEAQASQLDHLVDPGQQCRRHIL